ncbi:hypothetical protein SAMN05443245_7175 [Paraburkholderia fungorum]|uniref:Uncharacterized protein n=1 Tax=Paraburkholderia fungorum TaxID=134537 RepID=A0A1H1JS80_9BURK|nr:hypothetical protein [Paraburkholderia fungorum]SDR52377.1 hypothetical protein SAMN05443245_7175 [Paraburkholderia fungorum]
MPNVTINIPAEHMPPHEKLAELSRDCVELCAGVLQAAPENVHVIYVEVRHGHGYPVFAEIQYRVETFRTPAVMDQFMEALDDAIARCTGVTARIRCFGYPASNIHARN